MSMIEGAADQLSEVANTPATETLIRALTSLRLAEETFTHAVGKQEAMSPKGQEVLGTLTTAIICTQDAIGYVLGSGITIREYAHRVGMELAPPIPRPLQGTSRDAEYFLPEGVILAKLIPGYSFEGAPDSHLPEAVTERAKSILTDIRNGVKYENVDGHISSGLERVVFSLPGGNVLKLPYLGGGSTASSKEEALILNQEYVAALNRAQGREGFEQFVGWFDEAIGATICKEIPGQTLVDMSPTALQSIPQEHFDQLMQTVKEAGELCINIDVHPTNTLYDPQIGFTFIDFGAYEDLSVIRPEHVAWAIGSNEGLLHDRVIDVDDYMTLQRVGRKFYYAYEDAFGVQAANHLRQIWREEGIFIPTESW